jgi:hypothetical protein
MTSNEERDFPAAFLRRCIRFAMPEPDERTIRTIVHAHLGMEIPSTGPMAQVVSQFVERLRAGERLAIDQLLNAVFLLAGQSAPEGAQREVLKDILLRELSRA